MHLKNLHYNKHVPKIEFWPAFRESGSARQDLRGKTTWASCGLLGAVNVEWANEIKQTLWWWSFVCERLIRPPLGPIRTICFAADTVSSRMWAKYDRNTPAIFAILDSECKPVCYQEISRRFASLQLGSSATNTSHVYSDCISLQKIKNEIVWYFSQE